MHETVVIAGVDEVGRGPLAGPVVAAAVILDADRPIPGLKDSKKLTAIQREAFAARIQAEAVAWAVAEASVAEIDQLNILQASLLAMRRAVLALSTAPTMIYVDGNRLPSELPCPAQAIIGGDATVAVISAASIVAKVHRDAILMRLDAEYPDYGFARHKGYGTRQHLQALDRLGATPIHRRSFAPVRRVLSALESGVDGGVITP